nr:hypothetical protein [Tanacetum cinerariifolium]
MARRRKRLGAKESRPGESRPTGSGPTESRPMESRPKESRPTESRPRVGEGQSNDIPNNATINDNTDETITENTTENLNNPSNGRKQVQVMNGLLDKSSECSREITKIFKERIDDTGAWTNFTSHWATSKYKEIQEKNTQNRLKGEGSSTHTGGSISFREHANNLESIYKRLPTGFELFLHTHTSVHDKITFINEKSKTIHVSSEQEREGNQASAGSQVDETALYIEAASGAKKRNLYGVGSKRVDYIKDKDSGNETTGIAKINDGWEKIVIRIVKILMEEMLIKDPTLVTPEQVKATPKKAKERKMTMIAA